MRNISDQINTQINRDPILAGSVTCSVSQDCEQVDCEAPDGEFSIIRSCSPVGVVLKFVNTTDSPPQTDSQLFTESGVFEEQYQVTVDQKSNTQFGFALRIHVEDEYFVFDLPLVNHTFIPTTSCGATPTSGTTTTVPTDTTDATSTAIPSTATAYTDTTSETSPSTASPSVATLSTSGPSTGSNPTSGGTPTAPPQPSSDLCRAMRNVSDQINTQINRDPILAGSVTCSVSQDCEQVDCDAPDGKLSIIRSCSPVGVVLKFVNTSDSPPQTDSQLFTESGVFEEQYQVTVDQKSNTQFGFALRIHVEDEYFVFDLPLVNHTFIPTTSCGATPTSGPTGSSSSPTGSTDDPNVLPVFNSTCDAMQEVADQLNYFLNCSRSDNCSAVACKSEAADLNLYLGCSPVGMTLEIIVHTDGLNTYNKALFTKPGTFDSMLFDSDFNVTVHNYNDEVLEFSLLYEETDFTLEVVNTTLIPLENCNGDSSNSKQLSGKLSN